MGDGGKEIEEPACSVERLEKVELGMIVKKCEIRKDVKEIRKEVKEIRKDVKSTTEEETMKRRIMIFNLKKKEGKSDVECVKDVFEMIGQRQRCDGGGATATERRLARWKMYAL